MARRPARPIALVPVRRWEPRRRGTSWIPVVLLTSLAVLGPAGSAEAASDPSRSLYLTPGQLSGAVVTTEVLETSSGSERVTMLTQYFDTRGRQTLLTAVTTEPDGAASRRTEQSWEYDARGRLWVETTVLDEDGDGALRPLTRTTTTTFDKSDYVTSKLVSTDTDSDGTIDSVSTVTFGLDHRGRTLTATVEDDTDNDGTLDGSFLTALTYDGRGRILGVEETTRDGDGAVLRRVVSNNGYDSQGRLVGQTQSGYDGSGSLQDRWVLTSTYDKRGNQVTLLQRVDFDGDGTIDLRQEFTYEYDSGSRLVYDVVSSYNDDSAAVLGSRSEARHTYDSKGRTTGAVIDYDGNGDGATDARTRQVITYDGQGRRSTDVTEQDNDGDGTYDHRFSVLHTYDGRGRPATTDLRATQVDGPLQSATLITYAYPSKTTLVITMTFDDNGDGIVDSTFTQTRTVT